MNPSWHTIPQIVNKSIEKINEAQVQLEKNGKTGNSIDDDPGWLYNLHTIPHIIEILATPKEILSNLKNQFENVESKRNRENQ